MLIVCTLYLSSGSCKGVKIKEYCTSDIYKQFVLILSRLSDSAQGRRYLYFRAHAVYLSLRTSYSVTRQICSSWSHKHNL